MRLFFFCPLNFSLVLHFYQTRPFLHFRGLSKLGYTAVTRVHGSIIVSEKKPVNTCIAPNSQKNLNFFVHFFSLLYVIYFKPDLFYILEDYLIQGRPRYQGSMDR